MVEDHEHFGFGEIVQPEALDEGVDSAGVVWERRVAQWGRWGMEVGEYLGGKDTLG
jgi:hypothetical protein